MLQGFYFWAVYLPLETLKMCGRLSCFIFKYLSVILKTECNLPLDLIYRIYYILSLAVTRQKSWSNDGKLGKFKNRTAAFKNNANPGTDTMDVKIFKVGVVFRGLLNHVKIYWQGKHL